MSILAMICTEQSSAVNQTIRGSAVGTDSSLLANSYVMLVEPTDQSSNNFVLQPIKITTTDSQGNFQFDNLLPREYQIVAEQTPATALPAAYVDDTDPGVVSPQISDDYFVLSENLNTEIKSKTRSDYAGSFIALRAESAGDIVWQSTPTVTIIGPCIIQAKAWCKMAQIEHPTYGSQSYIQQIVFENPGLGYDWSDVRIEINGFGRDINSQQLGWEEINWFRNGDIGWVQNSSERSLDINRFGVTNFGPILAVTREDFLWWTRFLTSDKVYVKSPSIGGFSYVPRHWEVIVYLPEPDPFDPLNPNYFSSNDAVSYPWGSTAAVNLPPYLKPGTYQDQEPEITRFDIVPNNSSSLPDLEQNYGLAQFINGLQKVLAQGISAAANDITGTVDGQSLYFNMLYGANNSVDQAYRDGEFGPVNSAQARLAVDQLKGYLGKEFLVRPVFLSGNVQNYLSGAQTFNTNTRVQASLSGAAIEEIVGAAAQVANALYQGAQAIDNAISGVAPNLYNSVSREWRSLKRQNWGAAQTDPPAWLVGKNFVGNLNSGQTVTYNFNSSGYTRTVSP
jgi:hypothetical protein